MIEPNSNIPCSDCSAIRNRTVVLLPGFDPRGASYYSRLLNRQFKAYGSRENIPVETTQRKRWRNHWHRWDIKTNQCQVSFFYVEWDDIIRKYWLRGRFKIFLHSFRAYTTYLTSLRCVRGALSTAYSQIGFYYPLISFLLLYSLLMTGFGMTAWHLGKNFGLSNSVVFPCVFLSVLFAMLLAHVISPRLNGEWILRSLCYTQKIGTQGIPEWNKRVPILAEDLAEQLRNNPTDELLIVAHSMGTIKAIQFLGEFLKNSNYTGKVSYMAIGQSLQLVTFLQKNDGDYNRCLREVAENPRLEWVDFTMPSDGGCIALQDPARAALDPKPIYPHADLPKFLSSRFMEGYSKQRFEEMKRDHFEYHFQYYKTHDKAAQFEFAAIVLGEKSLAKRFAHRKNQARNRPK